MSESKRFVKKWGPIVLKGLQDGMKSVENKEDKDYGKRKRKKSSR